MYGATSSHYDTRKTSVSAVCGFAAVVAIAGLVGYAVPSALYSATAVRPQVAIATVPVVAPSRGFAAVNAVVQPAAVESAVPRMTSSSIEITWPVAMGVTAVAAVIGAFLGRRQSVAMAATSGERLVWIPGATPPAHLTGEYPGDRGFDPLGLSKDPKTFERMRISEVFHGRLAMLGVIGCIAPEFFFNKDPWFVYSTDIDWYRVCVAGMQVCAPLEYWRGNGGFGWNGDGLDRSYPGFDPLSLTTEDTKLREIKNGRLAMVAMFGFEAQSHVTGQGPIANLYAHLADPVHNGIWSSGVAMFATAGKKERPLWFIGAYSPPWLTGEYPGDRGFDPFGLSADPKVYERMRRSEVFHGRLCMLALVGAGVQEFAGLGPWWTGPEVAGWGKEQWVTATLLCGLPEIFRGQGGFYRNQMDKSYPGFDPLNLTTDYTKEAEIKNGRLAISACAGFWVQWKLTGVSPFTNLVAHWKHPFDNNIAATLANAGSNSVAMFASAGHKDGVWFPGATPPAHLTGEFPGDRGFDPLSLAYDKEVYARMRVGEVINGRFAMLGVLAALVPELLGKGAWYEQNDLKTGLIVMLIAAPTEYWRGQGGFGWDKDLTRDRTYPGFDPLKMTTDYTKAAEVKNGRLAMLACAGFAVQHLVTNDSPFANVAAHLSNPLGANIVTNLALFATTGSKWTGRGLWFPNAVPAPHLTGEFPGDRGFDPAGMSADPKQYARMRVAEVFNGRVAMLAVVGCLWPEIIGNGAWYDVGNRTDLVKDTLIALQVIAPLEYWRGNGGFGWNAENEGQDRSYPGFDPLRITDEATKNAEIRNGRLAMIAMAGFEVQHHVTGKSPIQNVADHLANPIGANIAESLTHPWPVAMFASSGHKDGVWFPGATPPAHLTGEFPGDRGFDPLSLAYDKEVYARMRVGEVINGRFAMIGVLAALVPELLGKGSWYEQNDLKTGLIVMLLAAPTEYWRGQGGFGWDKDQTRDRTYPGFDPLKMTTDYTKAAEVKNGRLAMLACAGFAVQHLVTGQSPLADVAAHLSNPLGANIIANLS